MFDRIALGVAASLSLAAGAQALDAKPAPLGTAPRASLDSLIAAHAKANGVPETLVHRVVQRESRYNPRAVGRGGAMGLMQIKHGTARALGYAGSPSGLLDADTNLTYAVRYLAGAYKVAGGNENRAVAFFARGYYYDAKRKGMTAMLAKRSGAVEQVAEAEPAMVETETVSETPDLSPFFGSDSSK